MAKTPSRTGGRKTPRKQTSDRVSKLASDTLAGRVKPTPKQVRSLAGSVLSQDETKGKRGR